MYGTKPVTLELPASEMADIRLLDEYEKWTIAERIAHAAYENNLDSGCLIAFKGRWLNCLSLVNEIENEMKRRGLNG